MKKWVCLLLTMNLMLSTAYAAPSISALEQERTVEIVGESGETQALAGERICTSRAITAQYTGMEADVIRRAEETFEENGTNGHTIAETIPSVERIFAGVKPSEEQDLTALRQLTYMQDFKYLSTLWRIMPEEALSEVIEVTIDGGECMKAATREDFVILQLNIDSGELYWLEIKEYDAQTGIYTVELPCFGPYMVTLKMNHGAP